ncbi:hypothetical protein [uncultured Treponema sp.]|nr:hypothetical protein [uncultured Treponema sp.]
MDFIKLMQGKGNEDRHYSAPHGAGPDMGLKEAIIGLVNNESGLKYML